MAVARAAIEPVPPSAVFALVTVASIGAVPVPFTAVFKAASAAWTEVPGAPPRLVVTAAISPAKVLVDVVNPNAALADVKELVNVPMAPVTPPVVVGYPSSVPKPVILA